MRPRIRYSLMYVSRGPERWTPVLKVTLVWEVRQWLHQNLMDISNLLDSTHSTQSSHFTAENWQRVVVELIYGPLPSCSRASMKPQQGVPPGACPVPIHVQPERNYGEIPSLSFTWADVSMASSTVVFRRSCRISHQLLIATANLEIDSYLGLLSLPISLPVADWAVGLNSSLVFSSFFMFTSMLVLMVGRLYFSTLWFFNLAIWLGLARGFW